jgi:hypothetical protein
MKHTSVGPFAQKKGLAKKPLILGQKSKRSPRKEKHGPLGKK